MLFIGVTLCVAVACLVFPRAVQQLAVRAVGVGPVPEAVKSFVHSNAYLWNVRAVGVVALAMAVFLAYAAIRSA